MCIRDREALLSGADVTIIGRDNVSWMTKNIFFDFDMVDVYKRQP